MSAQGRGARKGELHGRVSKGVLGRQAKGAGKKQAAESSPLKKPKKRKSGKPRQTTRAANARAPERASKIEYAKSPLKSAPLLWLGTTTGALTLLGGLQSTLDLADWANYLASHWVTICTTFWGALFSSLGLQPNPDAAAALTFFSSMTGIGVAAMIQDKSSREHSFYDRIIVAIKALAISLVCMFLFWYAMDVFAFGQTLHASTSAIPAIRLYTALCSILCGFFFILTSGIRETLHYLLLALLTAIFYVIVSWPAALAARNGGVEAISEYRRFVMEPSIILFPLQLMPILSWATPNVLNSKLLYVVMLLATIVVLSFVSQAGLSIRPPT